MKSPVTNLSRDPFPLPRRAADSVGIAHPTRSSEAGGTRPTGLAGNFRQPCWLIAGLLFLTALLSPASAQVRVTGGMREADPFNYDWTLTNDGDVPVTSFEISHYNGHIPLVPDGWKTDLTEKAYYDKKVGVGRFKVTATGGGLRKHQSITFSLHIHARGASRRQGEAVVGLADGRTMTIPNVEHPGKVSPVDTLVAPLALGSLFAIFVLYRVLRGRRQRKPEVKTSG